MERTDLDNGVLLCTGCHHRVHRDGWQVETRDGQVWITAPPSVDPLQKPRLVAGRACSSPRKARRACDAAGVAPRRWGDAAGWR